MEILGKILGNPTRVKIMRLFLFNRGQAFTLKDIVKRSRSSSDIARKEIKLLAEVGFIKRKGQAWSFNSSFKYSGEFEELLLGSDILSREAVLKSFKKAGRLKLLILSGIFIKSHDSRADMLIVGDGLKRTKIEESLRKMEAELGGELSYVILDTKEFLYRLDMYDKLVRDILDFPHEVILESKELSTAILQKG